MTEAVEGRRIQKICVITCYREPDYVRASTLRAAARTALSDDHVIVVKNSHKGILRYPEVLWKTIRTRLEQRPDLYLLTFRGYEVLLPIRLLVMGKPLIFDEFINVEEWLIENKKIKQGTSLHKVLGFFYRLLIRMPNLIITDTQSHADYSARLSKLSRGAVVSVPVGTDEDIFNPKVVARYKRASEGLSVFYYGSMLPLHGLEYVLDAARKLKDQDIQFTVIGGGVEQEKAIGKLRDNGVKVEYIRRVPYVELARLASAADICLGGPFGDTLQSQFVVTGKTYQFMAIGKPTIIGRNLETETETFVDKENCLVVERASSQSIADVLLWCLEHKDKLPGIGRAATKTYQTKLSIDCVADRLKNQVFSKF